MIHYSILQEFQGKNVDVTTVKREFSGTLQYDVPRNTLVVTPVDPWTAKRYGPAVIGGEFVVAIRQVLPRDTSKDCCDGEDDCCDTDKKSESKG